MNSSDIKKRAQELSAKTNSETISPSEVGGIMYDTVSYMENVERNGSSLGIRKTYESVSAMEADSNPTDDDGNLLKKGMLVNIYSQDDPSSADNGKIFSWQNPGWAFRTKMDAGYATKQELSDHEAEADAKFSELEYKLIKLVGMGATGIEAGVKDIGDVCYNTQTKLLRMAIEKPTPTSAYVTIPYYNGAIYTIGQDLYVWNGNDLIKITDNSGSININELKYKLIKLVGMGATGIEAGVKKIGDICYNTKTKLLRMAIEEPTPTSAYVTIPYYDGAIYTIGQDLYVWNGNDLVKVTGNSGSDGSGQEQEFNDEDCTAAFIVAMKNKAKKIGMNITIEGVAGYPDNQISDAKSCAKMFMCASGYDVLARIWDTKDDITIHSKGSINASHLLHSTVYSTDGQGHYANQLTDYYTVLGGKTGSVNTKMVYGVVVKGKDDTLLVGWVRLNTIESTSINRYKAMKILMDIAFKKQENISEDISTLETQLKEQHVTSAQVLQIPNNVSIYETFDIYNEKYTNYNLYGYNNDTMDSIASNTKILTIMTALDYITDINDLVTMKSIDFVGGGSSANPEFAAGEQFTIRELIFSMVMPSSNSAARALARYIGNILLRDKYIIL